MNNTFYGSFKFNRGQIYTLKDVLKIAADTMDINASEESFGMAPNVNLKFNEIGYDYDDFLLYVIAHLETEEQIDYFTDTMAMYLCEYNKSHTHDKEDNDGFDYFTLIKAMGIEIDTFKSVVSAYKSYTQDQLFGKIEDILTEMVGGELNHTKSVKDDTLYEFEDKIITIPNLIYKLKEINEDRMCELIGINDSLDNTFVKAIITQYDASKYEDIVIDRDKFAEILAMSCDMNNIDRKGYGIEVEAYISKEVNSYTSVDVFTAMAVIIEDYLIRKWGN